MYIYVCVYIYIWTNVWFKCHVFPCQFSLWWKWVLKFTTIAVLSISPSSVKWLLNSSPGWINPDIIIYGPSLSVVTILGLESIICKYIYLHFSWTTFFHPFILSFCMSLNSKWVSCRQCSFCLWDHREAYTRHPIDETAHLTW